MKNKINLQDYFTTLSKDKTDNSTSAKINIEGYKKLGYILESILNVCRQGLEATPFDLQIAENMDYCNLLELATDLIPHSEFELLDRLKYDVNKSDEKH